MRFQFNITKQRKCRLCSSDLERVILDLGLTPLSNSFLKTKSEKESVFPLKVYFCINCFLVQIPEYENPEKIFLNYPYFSSYSETWLEHCKNYVNMVIEKFGFDKNNLVVEIASNDGYLLQFFKKANIKILGIEPAFNIAKIAEEKGIPTITKFFGEDLAKKLVNEGKKADLVIGNNVLAHVPNLNDFISGLNILTPTNGIITLEFPHLLKLLQNNQFDTIYHEHFSYFSLITLEKSFSRHGLVIFDVDELTTHGGSLRIYLKHIDSNQLPISPKVKKLQNIEIKSGLTQLKTYENFTVHVNQVKKQLQQFCMDAKNKNKKIIGYGAPAKGNTLLNYCQINNELIEYTVDVNPYKQGLFLPGTKIPIKSPEVIRKDKPDYILILPWNLKDEIMNQHRYISEWGGRFVIPIPEVKIYK